MKVFEVRGGIVKEGAYVDNVHLKAAGFSYKAISVGEHGKGRYVANLPVNEQALTKQGSFLVLLRADLGNTRRGKPKLFKELRPNYEKCIVVFREPIGFRGSNSYTGNCILETIKSKCPKYLEFPGSIITEGIIAQGHSGQSGRGTQIIAIIPKNVVFRTAHSDRSKVLESHYYIFDGERIITFG